MTAFRADLTRLERRVNIVMWTTFAGIAINILIKILTAIAAQAPAVPAAAPSTIETGNVTIGEAKPESRRVYLTTGDVAEAERISERQVVQLISTGRIHPQPERSGRAWRIAADYRILPQTAAVTATTETP